MELDVYIRLGMDSPIEIILIHSITFYNHNSSSAFSFNFSSLSTITSRLLFSLQPTPSF